MTPEELETLKREAEETATDAEEMAPHSGSYTGRLYSRCARIIRSLLVVVTENQNGGPRE